MVTFRGNDVRINSVLDKIGERAAKSFGINCIALGFHVILNPIKNPCAPKT
jgi:hypothetical protein